MSSQLLVRSIPAISWINVKDAPYGAIGNDTADDAAAITRAIAALPPTGSALYFPPGVYKSSLRTVLRGLANVSVIGEGATLHCTASASGDRVLQVDACAGVNVRGLTLEHSAGVRTTNADGLGITNCVDVSVEQLRVPYSLGVGIKVAGSRRVSVDGGCTVTGSLADGIGVYNGQRNGTADAVMTSGLATVTSATAAFTSLDIGALVRVTGAGAAGADLLSTISSVAGGVATLADNAQTDVAAATVYIARSCEHVSIGDCHVDSAGDDSISVVGYQTLTGITLVHHTDIEIGKCTTKYGLSRGIMLAGVKRASVAQCGADSSRNAGILVWHDPGSGTLGVQDVTVDDCTVNNANIVGSPVNPYPSIGVESPDTAYPADSVTVKNCKVRGGAQNYILAGSTGAPNLNGVTNVRIEDNDCQGGNGAGSGIKVIRTNNAKVTGNVVPLAYGTGVYVETDVTGLVNVSRNTLDRPNQGGGSTATTFGIYCPTPGAQVQNNRVYDTGGLITTAISAAAATGGLFSGNHVGSLAVVLPAAASQEPFRGEGYVSSRSRGAVPSDYGFAACSLDPRYASTTYTAAVAGRIYAVRLWLDEPQSLSKVNFWVQGLGIGLANSFVGIADSNQVMQGVSADQSADWVANTGWRDVTCTPSYVFARGAIYVVFLVGTAGTMINLRTGSGTSMHNKGSFNQMLRTAGTANASLPAAGVALPAMQAEPGFYPVVGVAA